MVRETSPLEPSRSLEQAKYQSTLKIRKLDCTEDRPTETQVQVGGFPGGQAQPRTTDACSCQEGLCGNCVHSHFPTQETGLQALGSAERSVYFKRSSKVPAHSGLAKHLKQGLLFPKYQSLPKGQSTCIPKAPSRGLQSTRQKEDCPQVSSLLVTPESGNNSARDQTSHWGLNRAGGSGNPVGADHSIPSSALTQD